MLAQNMLVEAIKEDILGLAEGRKNSFASEHMTRAERLLKKNLIALLRDDGKGHHHNKYADRLEPFIVRITPLNDPNVKTCAISFDEGTIYINEGFLVDPKKEPEIFGQLSMLMRHELCHNLLMHQIRLMKYITSLEGTKLSMSASFHDVLNIIEDFEISNKAYTEADKAIVRATWFNGRIISGLVTEDHRKNWEKMTVEQMYDAIMKELEDAGWNGSLTDSQNSDTLNAAGARLMTYSRNAKSNEPAEYDSVDEMFADILSYWRKDDPNDMSIDIPQDWKVIYKGLKWMIDDPVNGYTNADFKNVLKQIGDSKPSEIVEVTSPVTGEILATLETPEDKQIAVEFVKILSGNIAYPADFLNWFNEITDKLDNTEFTDAEIQELLDCLK